ncbi:MAG: DUF4337 family protein [Actinomycetes bacterium]
MFTLFSGEAHAHLGTLHAEHETLINHGVVTDDMMRAAHTLAGLAGTVQLDALRELGYAFEHALSQLAADTLSEDEPALVAEALAAIARMVAAAVEMRVPKPPPELIVRLNNAVAVTIALLSTFMVVYKVKDDNIVQAMQQAQADKLDHWNFYQARNIREEVAAAAATQLRLAAAGAPSQQQEGYGAAIASYERLIADQAAKKEDVRQQAEQDQRTYDALNYR